jgi:DNA helicase-2/ATP-dependent DNA helicase PcrA
MIETFVDGYYRSHAVSLFDNAEHRLEDVDELVRFTARYETVAELLGELALLTNLDADPAAADRASGATVRLSTIHQAKGLEWQVVFILWAMEGMFPSQKTIMEEGDMSEERRLFYVATTRAKDLLFLCCPRFRRTRDGGVQAFMPSRFVHEVPGPLVRTVRPPRGF